MDELPLEPPPDPRPPGSPPAPAPAWVALAAAWGGLLTLGTALVLPWLGGSRRPRAELEGRAGWSAADRWLPVPVYLSAIALFLGIVVLWQMRREPRPLPQALGHQRLQAWTGIGLALAGIAFFYGFVAVRAAWRGS